MARFAIIDYGIGNLRSAEKALQYLGADASLCDDAAAIARADAVVLPGVGNFGSCVDALRSSGLVQVLADVVASGRPLLGICVGMQMLFDGSEESPESAGLGIIDGTVVRLDDSVRLPHISWNTVKARAGSKMFAGLEGDAWFYFAHSYAARADHVDAAATCEYGTEFACAIERANIWATQFHPEKSGEVGLALLSNFVAFAN